MTDRRSKRLPDVLLRHVAGGKLKAAFDRVNRSSGVRTYDRTTLGRWQSGQSTPSDKTFVMRLAQDLEDPDLMAAWEDDTAAQDGDIRDIVTRFRGLTTDRKRSVLSQLLMELFRGGGDNRTAFSMRIELRAGLSETCHRLDVSLAWVGRLPPEATVEIVSDEVLLRHAYGHEPCIFRELVPLDAATLEEGYKALKEPNPALRYRPYGHREFIRAETQGESRPMDGVYRFDNDEAPSAEIRLNVCLPYPADLSMYPVMLGDYAVTGRAVITMVTDSARFSRPHALHFLGRTPAWDHPGDFERSELFLEIGDETSIVEPNSGVIFFWHPAGHQTIT